MPAFSRPLRSRTAPWLRVLAVLCAGLVLAVSFATGSPDLHAWLHGESSESAHACASHAHHSPADDEDSGDAESHACAVTLFAHGVALADASLATLELLSDATPAPRVSLDLVALPRPDHLLPQTQAPPTVG